MRVFCGVAQYASRHEQVLSAVLGPSLPAKRTRTIAQFDTDVVCKVHGYASLQHYYIGIDMCTVLFKLTYGTFVL